MKIILVMVTSLDGRSTIGEKGVADEWNSEEDKKHFQSIVENGKLLIMGSTTYESAKSSMVHRDGKLRIVITRDPLKYDNEKIKDQLEFTNENPADLIKRLESIGFKEGYLLGGANTNTEFFKQNLVNELWQTLEPRILGLGNGLIGDEKMDIQLKLISFDKLNDTGTLLLKYEVVF